MSWSARVVSTDSKGGAVTIEFSKDGKVISSPTFGGIWDRQAAADAARVWINKYDYVPPVQDAVTLGAIDLTPPAPPQPDLDAAKKAAFQTAFGKAQELQKLVELGVVAKDAKEYTDAIADLTAAKAAL